MAAWLTLHGGVALAFASPYLSARIADLIDRFAPR